MQDKAPENQPRLQRVLVQYATYRDSMEIIIVGEERGNIPPRDRKRYVFNGMEWELLDDNCRYGSSMELPEKVAQELVNCLWECGIRPAAAKGSAGQLTAVQYHLEDMRKMVFKPEKEE